MNTTTNLTTRARAVLSQLEGSGQMTGRRLATAMGLKPVVLHQLLTELLTAGLVEDVYTGRTWQSAVYQLTAAGAAQVAS